MKKKLLLVTAISPFPTNSGGATRIYHTIEYLGKQFDLYLLGLGEEIRQKEECEFLEQNCRQWQIFPLGKKKISSRLPYHFSNYENLTMRETMEKWIMEQQIETVRVEFAQLAYMAEFIPENINKIIVMHDVATIAFTRRMKEKKWGGKKILASWWVLQMYFYEKKWLPKYQQIKAMSEIDKKYLQKFVSQEKITIEPNGIKAIDFLPKEKSEKIKLGFIGSQLHPPNQGAIKFVMEQILPQLEQEKIAYEFYLAGDNNLEIKNENIINLGRVAKKEDFFGRIEILLAPIMAGSGTRVKILEALSYGRPVITTKIGAEGLEIEHPYLQVVTKNDWLGKIKMAAQMENQDLANLKKQLEPYLWERVLGGGRN